LPKPKAKPTRYVQARGYVSKHPYISWGTVAAFFTVLSIAAGGVLWVVDHLQTKAQAQAHAQSDAVKDAWLSYGTADLRKLILQKWVAECKRVKGPETDDCLEASSQYEDAKQRAVDVYKAAMDSTKGQ
jgi:hypothetical protein